MTQKADGNQLVFLPLGGVGEIGMNMALYGYGPPDDRAWMMVDCGITFADSSLPGIDVMMPDTRFVEAELANLAGIVLTHAHEDHYGALLDLWPRLRKPVHATPFTAGLIAAKTISNGFWTEIPVEVHQQGDHFRVGPFEIEYVAMSHSIPEPNALAIRTPLGTVIHTGDWKIDHAPGIGKSIDVKRLRELGDEGVRALVCDSTNALRDGRSPSESEVAAELGKIIAAAPHRVAVTLFSSNVARIKAVADAARAAGRDVVVVGRALWRVIEVARDCGYLDGLRFLEQDAYDSLPRNKVVAICTGSQGEARAALSRIAAGDHRHVQLSPGDTIIFSSFTIPGNEKAVNAVINGLSDKGVNVITNRDAGVHTSGHPRRDELRELYDVVRPKVSVPVHGEAMHLSAHADLARSIGVEDVVVGRNGDIYQLAPDPVGIIDEAPTGLLYRDGDLLLEPDDSGVSERRKLGYAGSVVVALVLDRKANILAEPEVLVQGIPNHDANGDDIETAVLDAVEGAVESIPRQRRRDSELVREAARRAARAAVSERWGKKPMCSVIVSVV